MKQVSFLTENVQIPDLLNGKLQYIPEFLDIERAQALFQELMGTTDWRQENIRVFGKTHPTPRLSSWVGDPGAVYRYSHMTMRPLAWSKNLALLRREVEAFTSHSYNSVLLNLYRDGQDCNGWHSDDEVELGPDPVIASVSLGGVRDFQLRYKSDHQLKYTMALQPGSLLLMTGTTQRYWQHHIPRRAHAAPRINLTFRNILSS